MAEINPTYLLELIANRDERLDVEFKRWLPIDEPLARAKLAKHIAAICNHGGGHIFLGVEDDGSPSNMTDIEAELYTSDWVSGVVSKYLDPAPQCHVLTIPGQTFKAITIPSHGIAPVCAKANGPDAKGTPQGIRKGAYYIRAVGPCSIEIAGPDQWRDVIHRCVINERESLLSSIGRLFQSPQPPPTENRPDPRTLLDVAEKAWLNSTVASQLTEPHGSFAAYGFRFWTPNGPPNAVSIELLRRAASEAEDEAYNATQFGWQIFESSINGAANPTVVLWGDVDGLSDSILDDGAATTPRLWRLSTDGRGFEVRMFHEDTRWIASIMEKRSGTKDWTGGKFYSPRFQTVRALQFVMFVRRLARTFDGIVAIDLALRMKGLAGRELRDTSGYFSTRRVAAEDGRTVAVTATPEQLAGDGAYEYAAQLSAPFSRLFDGSEVNAERVRQYVEALTRG